MSQQQVYPYLYEFLYGVDGRYANVTQTIHDKWTYRNQYGDHVLHIPLSDDVRATVLGDPLFGTKKHLKVKNTLSGEEMILQSDMEMVLTIPKRDHMTTELYIDPQTADGVLQELHKTLVCHYGSFQDEYNEQRMNIRFVPPHARVLEIGGHIGRNSLILASVLDSSDQLVVIEPDPENASKLRFNRDANHFTFPIEDVALTRRKLIQEKGRGTACKTFEVETYEGMDPSYHIVKTMTWEALLSKYPKGFDTLVYDCEGAFYDILHDFPDLLDGIHLILQENDFASFEHKQWVDEEYRKRGFERIFVEEGGWPWSPCRVCFFEVWKRKQE